MIPAPANRSREPAAMSARDLLRRQFRLAHEFLDAAIDACPQDALHRCPQGPDTSAGVCYAQTVWCEDLSVNGVLAERAPLALSTWAGRTGLSELPPRPGLPGWRTWARRVRLDHDRLRCYATAVYASTDAYIAVLPVEAFDPAQRDTPACVLTALLLNVSMRRGEIACLVALNTMTAVKGIIAT